MMNGQMDRMVMNVNGQMDRMVVNGNGQTDRNQEKTKVRPINCNKKMQHGVLQMGSPQGKNKRKLMLRSPKI